MSAAIVRLAASGDLCRLHAIEASAAETFTAVGDPLADGSPPTPVAAFRTAMQAGCLWVLESANGELIGFLAGDIVDDSFYVAEIDVLLNHQRKGHGRSLMRWVIDWALTERLTDITLTTFRDVAWNAPFYASMGFKEIPEGELSPHLNSALEQQAARGFDSRRRCAMRLALRKMG